MSIIKSHDITLYGGNKIDIILRPLKDEHLPLLYKWNADPQVLYWTEGGTADSNLSYGKETVHQIYGGVSHNAFCFLIEVDGVPIGECWLQKMNLSNVKALYSEALDVRRIDMSIGEKDYWNRGIGTQFIGMLIDFAFCGEYIDVLHCFCEDYNIRSQRMWEKHGFIRVMEEPLETQPQKGKQQYHYRLTRHEYIVRKRVRPAEDKIFTLPIEALQPSQLYISSGKLRLVNEWLTPDDRSTFDPIPIKYFGGSILMTDGHTRAAAACLAGWHSIPVYEDIDGLDMEAYAKDIEWCQSEGINNPYDLTKRILSHKDYEELWKRRCMEM